MSICKLSRSKSKHNPYTSLVDKRTVIKYIIIYFCYLKLLKISTDFLNLSTVAEVRDRLCGLVVRVSGYR